jgi:hypothetical protein
VMGISKGERMTMATKATKKSRKCLIGRYINSYFLLS